MKTAPERFETERLVATRYREASDLAELQALNADPELMRHIEAGGRSAEKAREGLAKVDRQWAAKGYGYWTLREKTGPAVVGGLVLFDESPTGGVEVGYLFARRVWGKGFATEAVTALVGIAFGALGFSEVWARVEPENTASVKVLTKLGFEHVRTLPDEKNIPLDHYRLIRRSAPATSPRAGRASK